MDLTQTGQLLVVASSVDNRIVTDLMIAGWHEALGRLDYDDCRAALAHHRANSGEYVQPHHIAAGVRRIVAQRNTDREAAGAHGDISRGWHPKPSPELFDRMSQAWNDPVEFARLRTEYQDELLAKGYSLAQGNPYEQRRMMRGEGRDMAIPRGDR